MNFGETLKKLRKQKDMTQEQLAEYLNISTQAVSRWETNSSLPDITLLPMLANIFDVTTDTLLGVDITAKEQRINDIISRANEYSVKGYKEEATEILRNGLREYPNSYIIMKNLIINLYVVSEQRDNSKTIISLGEKILAECTDDSCRYMAIQYLCYTYAKAGELEKAEMLAKKLPSSPLSRDALFLQIYSGEKLFRQFQDSISTNLVFMLVLMGTRNAVTDDGSCPYTSEEIIAVNKKITVILEVMFEDGNYGSLRQIMKEAYITIARQSAKIGDYDTAIENLQLAAEHSIIQDKEYNPDNEYTSLMFKGKKFGDMIYQGSPENDSMSQLDVMKRPDFDAIRENKAFIEIEERLKKYAKKR